MLTILTTTTLLTIIAIGFLLFIVRKPKVKRR